MQVNSLSLSRFENRKSNSIPTFKGQSNIGRFELKNNVSKNTVSFKAGLPSKAYGAITEGLAKGLGKFIDTKFAKSAVDFFNGESKNKVARFVGKTLNIKEKWFQHAIAAESVYLTSFYMYNTHKSKAIPDEQKRPMMVNQALVTTLCTALGYTVDNKISKVFNKAKSIFTATNVIKIADNMKNQVSDAVKNAKTKGAVDAAIKLPLKHANGIANGISKLKSVLVFGFIYRYFSPVFITPIANRVSELIDKKKASSK